MTTFYLSKDKLTIRMENTIYDPKLNKMHCRNNSHTNKKQDKKCIYIFYNTRDVNLLRHTEEFIAFFVAFITLHCWGLYQ